MMMRNTTAESSYSEQLVIAIEAGVPLVVKVVFGVAPALAPCMSFALWAVLEGIVPVSYADHVS